MVDWAKIYSDKEKYSWVDSFSILELLTTRKNEGKGPIDSIRDYLSPIILLNKKGIRFLKNKE